MKPRIALLAAFVLLAAAAPQQEPEGRKCCDDKGPKPWPDYNKGVKWSQPAVETVEKARRENKLIMLYQLVGDLDKEGC